MKKTTTIRDIAKIAEVGIGTVSRVLNNNPSVREDTRQRVLDVIDELNFVPNPIARRLVSGKTNTVAIILQNLTTPSLVERLRGVQSAMAVTDYALVLYCAETHNRLEELFLTIPNKTQTDGVIIVSIPPAPHHVNHFLMSGIPVVLIDIYEPRLDHVYVDDIAGGELATLHLIELGHRNIAFIGDPIDTLFLFKSTANRLQGYKNALRKSGIPPNKTFQIKAAPHKEAITQAIRNLLENPDPPSAIFAASDTHAIAVIHTVREMGVAIPQELSVIGFDDIRDAEYVNLTTVRQPLYKSGYQGTELLFSAMRRSDKRTRGSIMHDLEIIHRGTTARAT